MSNREMTEEGRSNDQVYAKKSGWTNIARILHDYIFIVQG